MIFYITKFPQNFHNFHFSSKLIKFIAKLWVKFNFRCFFNNILSFYYKNLLKNIKFTSFIKKGALTKSPKTSTKTEICCFTWKLEQNSLFFLLRKILANFRTFKAKQQISWLLIKILAKLSRYKSFILYAIINTKIRKNIAWKSFLYSNYKSEIKYENIITLNNDAAKL